MKLLNLGDESLEKQPGPDEKPKAEELHRPYPLRPKPEITPGQEAGTSGVPVPPAATDREPGAAHSRADEPPPVRKSRSRLGGDRARSKGKLGKADSTAGKRRFPKLPFSVRLQPDREKARYAYWNVTGTLSLIVNAALIAIIILMSRELYSLKRMVLGDLVGGLYQNFDTMDQAHIRTEIPVQTEIIVDFMLPINQTTEVILTQDTRVNGARVTLTTGGLEIVGAPTNITLPAGTRLPIQLNLEVPVHTSVPVSLLVSVDIPLSETDLHQPFTDMRDNVIGPYYRAFEGSADTWELSSFCQSFQSLCAWWFR